MRSVPTTSTQVMVRPPKKFVSVGLKEYIVILTEAECVQMLRERWIESA